MRIIDADALIATVKQGVYPDSIEYAIAIGIIAKTIENAPTIEPPQGKWLVTKAWPHKVYCSLCFRTNINNEKELLISCEYPNYCMWCGAKLKGGEA